VIEGLARIGDAVTACAEAAMWALPDDQLVAAVAAVHGLEQRLAAVILHPEVQLQAVPGEPATTACGERRRLGLFRQTEDADIERTERVFGAPRAGELNVMDHGTSSSQSLI
jgi:hypothetical protein